MGRDYLLEIGCEEIPAGFVGPALWFGGQQFEGMLKKARLSFRKVDIYGTPRRLTYVIRDLEDRQAASKETVMGPPKSVGLDAAGKPTKAALGFARSQGIDVSALTVFSTDRGDYLGFGDISPQVLNSILFPSRDTGGTEQRSVTADVTGTVLQLPAGPLAAAAGLGEANLAKLKIRKVTT